MQTWAQVFTHARRADVSFRDVTIRIPDRGCDQGREWRHAPEAWAEIWEKSVSWVLPRLTFACSPWPRVGWGRGLGRWKSQVYLTPYVGKPFNSKLIRSFVPEQRCRQVFFVFRDSYVLWIYVMNILCTFHISVSWVCYVKLSFKIGRPHCSCFPCRDDVVIRLFAQSCM